MAVFAREIIGREVVDSHSVLLGILRDIVFDKQSGSISAIRVKVEQDIDPTVLPWEMNEGLMQIPVDEVSRIASRVHLKR
ncbi:MAG: PRC-barrel domain containing protein [Candidatus Poseidoniales archaeon]|nr:MAG: PRC-barrel domain containing protein [Candidatus Poseidoniales archaeon]